METYLTVAEVAELLKLNQQTVRNWIDRGELPAVRVGARRVRIRQSDLDQLIEKGMTNVALGERREDAPEPELPLAGVEEAYVRFRAALAHADDTAGGAEPSALTEALNRLAESAQELADALAPELR